MKQVKAPAPYDDEPQPWLFLSGSIEMGKARPWQKEVATALASLPGTILNPRRDDWDSSWVQSIGNPQFNEQVTWELGGLEAADVVAIYFDPDTKSPITLLELGILAAAQVIAQPPPRVLVCCPQGFWRRGNVEMVCDRYGIPLFDVVDPFVEALRDVIAHA